MRARATERIDVDQAIETTAVGRAAFVERREVDGEKAGAQRREPARHRSADGHDIRAQRQPSQRVENLARPRPGRIGRQGDEKVDVDIDELATPRICGHPQAFFIAVNNLVRNAFEHTLDGQGPIRILINAHELLITNQVSTDADGHMPIDKDSTHGYGLGLGIVQRLCERNGWSFSLRADEGHVVARLSWWERTTS